MRTTILASIALLASTAAFATTTTYTGDSGSDSGGMTYTDSGYTDSGYTTPGTATGTTGGTTGTDTGDSAGGKDIDCGCSSTGGVGGWMGLVLAAGALIRRRRD